MRVEGLGFRVSGFGFRVSGFGFQAYISFGLRALGLREALGFFLGGWGRAGGGGGGLLRCFVG